MPHDLNVSSIIMPLKPKSSFRVITLWLMAEISSSRPAWRAVPETHQGIFTKKTEPPRICGFRMVACSLCILDGLPNGFKLRYWHCAELSSKFSNWEIGLLGTCILGLYQILCPRSSSGPMLWTNPSNVSLVGSDGYIRVDGRPLDEAENKAKQHDFIIWFW